MDDGVCDVECRRGHSWMPETKMPSTEIWSVAVCVKRVAGGGGGVFNGCWGGLS